MASMINGAAFEQALCKALGIDTTKDKVIGIDIGLRPLQRVTVQITRLLKDEEADNITELLQGVQWEPVKDVES